MRKNICLRGYQSRDCFPVPGAPELILNLSLPHTGMNWKAGVVVQNRPLECQIGRQNITTLLWKGQVLPMENVFSRESIRSWVADENRLVHRQRSWLQHLVPQKVEDRIFGTALSNVLQERPVCRLQISGHAEAIFVIMMIQNSRGRLRTCLYPRRSELVDNICLTTCSHTRV